MLQNQVLLSIINLSSIGGGFMDGIFGKQKFTKVYNVIGLISGVFLVLLLAFSFLLVNTAPWTMC